MSVMSFSRADLAERQAAFTGLLAHPLLAPWTDPVLCRLVLRHEHTLEVWCARLGYRLVRIDQCFRLRRSPLDGLAASPRVTPPPRRPLVLALLVAALLEDHSQDSITLQEISDTLRHFAAANRFVPYDPDHRSHRVALVAAVHLLVAAKASARLWGRHFVIPDDVIRVAPGVLRHRLVLRPEAELDRLTPDAAVANAIAAVPVPR